MRRCWLVLLVAGCGDDYALDVVVEHPPALAIARTEVSVYEGAVTCGAIELGDVTDGELAPALVERETVVAGGASSATLSGISRRDPKAIVARVYGPDQALVASGCAEVGEITGHATVTIATEVAATASVGFVDRAADPTGIQLVVAGPDGRPLDRRAVSWRVYAPAGAAPARTTGISAELDAWTAAAPSCTVDGVATIHAVPPRTVGGYAIQPRVAWAVARPPLLTSLNVDPRPAQLGAIPGVRHPCAIGRTAAGPRLVCLTAAAEVSAFAVDATGALGAPATTTLGFAPAGVYAAPDGGDVGVFAIGATGQLARVFPTVETRACTTCGVFAIDDVLALPACGGAGAKALVHTAGAGVAELRWVDAGGGAMTAFPFEAALGATSVLRAAGCTSTIDATTGARATVATAVIEPRVAGVAARPHLAFDCTADACGDLAVSFAGAGVGFTADAQPALLVPTLDASGVVVTRAVLVRGAGGPELLELARQPAAAIPNRVASGRLDDDGAADALWDADVGPVPVLQIAYAREVEGAPLSAVGPLQRSTETTLLDLLVGDLTGDGRDDVALVSATRLDARLGLTVLASGAEVPGLVVPVDPTCP